jgi:RNA-directed DNA polymerase
MFEQIVEIKSLYTAWRKVRANKGAAGIDQISWFGFEQNLDANLAELSRNLRVQTYQPLPAKFVQMAKANGKVRELGILAIRDRVAQRAVLDVIEPIFEAGMQDCNFAFRPKRNIEMAVQRLLLHRTNGGEWIVESDIQNYFAEIDIRILLRALSRKIRDEKVLQLIELWLEAGILHESDAEAEKTWWQMTQANLAELHDAFGETVEQNLDEFISSKLGLSPYEAEYLQMNPEVRDLLANPETEEIEARIKSEMRQAKTGVHRQALKKLLESGLLYALSNRAMLAGFLGMKALGIGGLVVVGGLAAPKIYTLVKDYFRLRKGILQGSPISPLLANIYLTDFDKSMTANGFRLIRYCDDFVIACRSREEAEMALQTAQRELGQVKLSLHPEKTRIIEPNGEFEFLGFSFGENGVVEKSKGQSQTSKSENRVWSKLNEQISPLDKLRNWKNLFTSMNRRENKK